MNGNKNLKTETTDTILRPHPTAPDLRILAVYLFLKEITLPVGEKTPLFRETAAAASKKNEFLNHSFSNVIDFANHFFSISCKILLAYRI